MYNSCIYKPAGTDSFRLASTGLFKTKVLVDGKLKAKAWGSNLQNLEKSVRRIYIPEDGMDFVQVDQSGAEALIVAYCCVAGQYRQLFIHEVKPHTYMALNLFPNVWPRKMMEHRLISSPDDFNYQEILDCAIKDLKSLTHWKNLANLVKSSDDWSLQERYYYLAKQTEHSSNFDIQPPTFRMNVLEKSGGKIVISEDDSKKFLGVKHNLFPEIKGSYHQYVKRCARDARCLYNLHGHPFQITDFELLDSKWKELYAWIPQSTVGEITNIAYTRMFTYIIISNSANTVNPTCVKCPEVDEALQRFGATKLRCDLLANTHDSYMAQAEESQSLRVAKVMKFFIEQKFTSPIDGVPFQMRSEAQVGKNWGPRKEKKQLDGTVIVENEKGLVEVKV